MKKYLLFSAIGIAVVVVTAAISGIRIFSGEDSWICDNGRWIKHGNPSAPMPVSGCGEMPNPGESKVSDEIIVTSPQPNGTINSPVIVEGKVRGNWFFEAVFPVTVFDEAGNIIGRGNAGALGEWMTTDFVPFRGEIFFQAGKSGMGKLAFANDNPSGLSENAKSIEIPVRFAPVETAKLKIFFNNDQLDPEISCNKVFPVVRDVPKTQAVARTALEELLKGPAENEKSDGYFTNINSGVKIQKLVIENGVVKVDFDEQLEFQVGGSCRVSAIRAQIVQTLKQFPTVKTVVISVSGRTEDILQP